ncbi:MAG TPA: HEAT repeat domain-containing protein [Pirellulales bacterium]|jgi:hypothetical protein
MRPRFTIAGMMWFSVFVGLLCACGALGHRLVHRELPDQLAASADGRVLVVHLGGGRLGIWDTAAGRMTQMLTAKFSYYLYPLIVSPDGQRVAAADVTSRQCELWVRDGLKFRQQRIPAMALNGPIVATSQDCRLQVTHNQSKGEFGIWSLDDGTRRATCSQHVRTASGDFAVGLDSGSGHLVVSYNNGQVEVFDAASGQLKKTIVTPNRPLAVPQRIDLSLDGRCAAIQAGVSPMGECWASIVDLEMGQEILWDRVEVPTRPVVFSSDSRQVAIMGLTGSIDLFELPNGAPRGPVGGESTIAIAAAGPGRWALLSPSELELRSDGGAASRVALWRDDTLDELCCVACGLLAWLLVTAGIHLRRGRIACSVCGEVRLLARRRPKPVCMVCSQQVSGRRAWVKMLLVIEVVCGLVVIIVAAQDWMTGSPVDWLSPLPLMAIFAAVFLSYVGLYIGWFIWRAHRLQGEAYCLKRATKAAGQSGTVHRNGPIVAWSPAENPWIEQVPQWIAEAGEDFARLTGLDVNRQPPLRLLVFRHWAELDRYVKLYGINAWPLPGIQLPGGKLATSLEGIRANLIEPKRLVHANSAYPFCQQHPSLSRAGWLMLGYLLVQDSWGDTRLLRKMRLALAADPHAGSDMFDSKILRCIMRSRRWYRTQDYARLMGLLLRRISMTSYLAGPPDDAQRRAVFRALLGDLASKTDWPQAAQRHYHKTPQELIDAWRDWILGQTPGEYPTPQPWQLEIIQKELLPIAHDHQQPLIARLRVLRGLADAGFTIVGRNLIELMSDSDPLVRADAVEALKMISGHDHGGELRAWRTWCDSLPATETLATNDA